MSGYMRYKHMVDNLNAMRLCLCLVLSSITVDYCASFFELNAGVSGIRLFDGCGFLVVLFWLHGDL